MKRRWTDDELKYFRKSITKQTDDTNEWNWWILFGAVVIMEVIFIGKIIGII